MATALRLAVPIVLAMGAASGQIVAEHMRQVWNTKLGQLIKEPWDGRRWGIRRLR